MLDQNQLKEDITINPVDLDSAITTHASIELHYRIQTAEANRTFLQLESSFEVIEAMLDAHHREALNNAAELRAAELNNVEPPPKKLVESKKPTEAQIEAACKMDPRWKQVQSKLIDAKYALDLCWAAQNSFASRKDLLLELARDRRKEAEGQLRVMNVAQNLNDAKDKALRAATA